MRKIILAQTLLATSLIAPVAAIAGEAELMQRIEKLSAELEQIKAELAASRQKSVAAEAGSQKSAVAEQRQQAAAPVTGPAAMPTGTVAAAVPPAAPQPAPGQAYTDASQGLNGIAIGPKTTIIGYGEVNYNRPTKDPSQAQTDVRRAVIGFLHRFDEKTRLVSEFEWEHAVTSASDSGETAVEQLFIEREFKNGMRGKAGLFLMPVGLLNPTHEPTAYYGVERNFVETAIIPTTWREAGLGLSSTLENGLTWDAGVTTGFDLTKWDPASTEGRESPLGAIHQEGQLAKSRNLSVHGALNWRGLPGVLLGGSVFTGKAGHSTAGFAAPDARVTLWDLHARYTPGRWDLAALYARGTINNIDALNLTFVGNPTPVPSSFYGWYTQAAYRLWQSGDYTLSPFVRYERFNTAKSYSAVPAGLGIATGPDEQVVTIGANFWVSQGVVLKADYQKFREDTSRDRLNLGVGFAF